MQPLLLPANQPANRFYRGGPKITAFRADHSQPPCGAHDPEDWIASSTCCHGQDTLGLTKLPSGKLLRDEIQANPDTWLGPEHVKAYGSDSTGVLVKLLDAGQRLPVHAHPHRDWAKKHVKGAKYGKAELWFVLEPGLMRVGLKETLSAERLRKIVDKQDVETLMGLMHAVPLERGQAVYIPPGVIHAIGEGMLIAEVQEPSDLSVFCEWRDFPIDGTKDGHLGLGFDVALTSIERQGRSVEDVESLITKPDTKGPLLPNLTGEYFTVERYSFRTGRQGADFPPGFAVVIVYEGENLKLLTSSGDGGADLTLRKGHTVVLPYAAGRFHFEGEGSVIIARPPSAHVYD